MEYRVTYGRRCIGAIGVFTRASATIEANARENVFQALWDMEDERGYEIINVTVRD